jgi:hypothetical protein
MEITSGEEVVVSPGVQAAGKETPGLPSANSDPGGRITRHSPGFLAVSREDSASLAQCLFLWREYTRDPARCFALINDQFMSCEYLTLRPITRL